MRSEKRRLETFQVQNYEFPLLENKAKYLAKMGFFYTLLNTTVQCSFCRILIGGVRENTWILAKHMIFSPDCPCSFGETNKNEPMADERLTVSKTDIEAQQCKICMENEINIIYDCGHLYFCSDCSDKATNCAVCRAPLVGRKRIFMS